jgi:hypothetical protein
MTDNLITLVPAQAADLPDFKRALQAAFALAVIEQFGELEDGPIPSDQDLDAAMATPGAQTLHIMRSGHKVGGAVVVIDEVTNQNRLDLFYIAVGEHGRGLGRKAWAAIEALFPKTWLWETSTPFFEKRNIHFYVNVCGFHIVEFFHARYPDRQHPANEDPGMDEMFLFRKVMSSAQG